MKRALLLCLMALLCACAHKSPAPEPQPEKVYPGPTGPCFNVYTYAPANFIVDVSAGSEVELDPVVHEFLYACRCTAGFKKRDERRESPWRRLENLQTEGRI